MESKRQKKFARLLQKDLGEIFQQNAHSLFEGAFITVTIVKVSPDLKQAKVFLSFLLAKNKELMMERVEENAKNLRMQLGQRIKNQVKSVPELFFYLDDTEDIIAEVDQLFSNIDIPPAEEEDETEE